MSKISYLTIEDEIKVQEISAIEDIELIDNNIYWINIQTDDYEKEINSLCRILNIKSAFINYIIKERIRTKIERYDNITYINSYLIKLGEDNSISYENSIILVRDNCIFTFSKYENNTFSSTMNEISLKPKEDYNTTIKLLLRIVYEIIEEYDDAFDIIEEKIDKVDYKIGTKYEREIIEELYLLRKDILYTERYVTPYRVIVNYLRETTDLSEDKKLEYSFKYVENNVENIIEGINISEELTTEIIDTINNLANEKTNEIMKTLTIWSTVFLPITFLAGVFGMNFKYMNGIEWEYAYHSFWVMSVLIVIIMIIYFKKKGY